MAKHYCWWIVAKENGKPYLIKGSERSELEAREKAFTMLGNMDFEIKKYPTTSLDAASQFFRGKRLEAGEGLHSSVERIGHQRSLDRVRRRRQPANVGPSWE